MASALQPDSDRILCCLHCPAALTADAVALTCTACGRQYPAVAGIPLLVRRPADYFRAERASLAAVADAARRRKSLLALAEPYAALPAAVLQRHRDVLEAEASQADTLAALLQPSASVARLLQDDAGESQARRPGWGFDTLVPYLLRDWTGSPELQIAGARINAAIRQAIPDASGRSIVFAGCGAGGLPAQVVTGFARVLAFDLALPILAAARRLLDGGTIALALPRTLNPSGRVTLGPRDQVSAAPRVELLAMDALDTAFAERSIDCLVTAFLTDILPDPCALADEAHRVLRDDGVWINYGPSGNNLKALWRFDQTEGAAFFQAAGFTVMHADAHRSTNLDISAICPPTSFRNAMFYLTVARKSERAAPPATRALPLDRLREIVPRHCPGAQLVHRLEAGHSMSLRHDRVPERPEHWDIGGRAARIMLLVDGKRTVGEIAEMLGRGRSPQPEDGTLQAFARYFQQGLLTWGNP